MWGDPREDAEIKELRARIEALEAAQKPAAPTAPTAPAGELVERVADAMTDDGCPADLWHDYARAAIRAVASWLRSERVSYLAANRLEQEADR